MSFSSPTALIAMKLEERNRIAQALIDDYSTRHGLMDVGVGAVGLIPGAAIPALMTAIAAQAPVIYQPLARKIAKVYLASPDQLAEAQDDIIAPGVVEGAIRDVVAEFSITFLSEAAGEILTTLGAGAALTFIPIVGAIAGAALDWTIATRMTQRVGRMTAMYFQNGGAWVNDKKTTFQMARETSALTSIRNIPRVRSSLITNLHKIISLMRGGMSDVQIREALRQQQVPNDLIDDALAA